MHICSYLEFSLFKIQCILKILAKMLLYPYTKWFILFSCCLTTFDFKQLIMHSDSVMFESRDICHTCSYYIFWYHEVFNPGSKYYGTLSTRVNISSSTERMIFKNVIERLKFIILKHGPQNNIRISNHETIMAWN